MKNEEDEEYHLIRQTILNNMRDLGQIQQDLDEEYGQFYQKQQIAQDNNKNTYIEVVIMDQFQEVKAYQDNLPLLYIRKKIMLLFTQISVMCDYTIHHSIFEGIILLVIIWNSIMLSLDDPTTDVQTDDQNIIENSFLIIYTIEMLLKIFAMGFVMDKKAYLKDIWNIIDFTIVLSGYLPLVIGLTVLNLSALRSLRILRPLRTINKIKPLRDIVQALFSAIGLLRDSIIILVFFYTIFAIGGLQLFMGILKRRCFSQEYGMKYTSSNQLCSDDSACSSGFVCGKMLENPDEGLTNFDNFGSSFLQVYIVCTMEGWTSIMQEVSNVFSPWVAIYFIAIVLIGAFFIVNLTLAIIKVNFSEAQDQKDLLIVEALDTQEHWDLNKIRELGVYQKKLIQISRQEKEDQKQYGVKSISYKINQSNFLFKGNSLRYYNSIENNQSDLTSPDLKIRRQTLKALQLSPLPLLPIQSVEQYSKPSFNTQIFRISPSKLVRMSPMPMIISKNGIKFAGMLGINQKNKVSNIIEQVEKSHISHDNNMNKSIKMENNYYRVENSLPNDNMKLSMKLSKSTRKKSNNNSSISMNSPENQKKIKQSPFEDRFIFDDEEMFALNNPPQSPRKKTGVVQRKQIQDMKASKRQKQPKSPPKISFYSLVSGISPSFPGPSKSNSPSPKLYDPNSVRFSKINSPRNLRRNSKFLQDEEQEMKPVSLFQKIQKYGGIKKIVQQKLAIEGLKQSINSDSSSQQDKDNKTPLNDDQFYSNIHDLGLQDIFEAQPKQAQQQQIVEEKEDESPSFNIHTNKRKQRNFIRQEVRRITMRKLSSEKGELTKEQQLLKESLLSSNKLITGIIPWKRLIESFKSEPDVLVKRQHRESARLLQKETHYRAIMKIKLIYAEETEKTKPRSINQVQSTIKSKSKSSVYSRKQIQQSQMSSKVMLEKRSNQLALTTGLNSRLRRKATIDIELNYKNICKLFKQSDPNQNEEENKEENTEDNDDNVTIACQQKVNADDAEELYRQICKDDVYKNNGRITINWSGFEVLTYDDYSYLQDIKLVNNIINNMNVSSDSKMIWISGVMGVVAVMRKHIKQFVQSKLFDTMIMSSVVINTLILSLDGLLPNNDNYILDQFNFYFTIIFTIDMGFKLIGLGKEYLLDKINIFDGFIVTLSIVELTILGGQGKGGSLQAFRAVRVFRVFRVLRVTRLIRSLRFMAVILDVISRTMQSFIYIFLLMILFLYIFALLGMSLFGGALHNIIRQNFDSFFEALICSFQILTLENWNDILRAALLSGINAFITLAYLVTWVFIGNWVFLNLFLSILLEGFEKRQMDEEVLEMEKEMEVMQNLNFDEPISQQTSQSTKSMGKNMSRRLSLFVTKESTEFQYFVQVGLCENSLMLFSQGNTFRRICYRIVTDDKFEAVIFTLIVFTSLQLVLDTYLNFDEISLILNITFTILFTVEAFMKIIAFGFAFSPSSYLTESWSQLDFFIVSLSWFDLGMQFNSSNLNLAFIRVLRLFRTLRPLRFISHNISMKLVVTALLESVSGIFNVAIVVLLVWMMFAILGMNLMAGKLNYCYSKENINVYDWRQNNCADASPGAYWNTYDMNFDNIISGMITLFVVSTLEGWPDYLFNFMDADDSGPIKNNSSFFFWYMMVFILVGSFFLLNLFIGVISLSYNLATKKAKNEYLSDDQSNWIEIQRLIVETRPFFPNQFSPQNRLRAFFFNILKLRGFEPLIMACIISNIVVMAMAHENSSESYDSILQKLNLAFTFIFIFEAIIKLLAFGITGYFNNNWNQFDFFVVVTSIADFLLDLFGSGIQGLKVGPQIARVFRVLRVSRLLRLIKSFQGLQKLIQTAIFSLPKLLNVLSLLMLNFFIFSVLACQLFGNISEGNAIGPDFNFLNFSQAFLLLIRCATGENWYIVMFDTTRVEPYCVPNVSCGSPYNVFFFIIYIVTVQFIMLNLFVLVILQQFEENYINPDNPLQNFADLENVFLDTWVKFTESSKGEKLPDKNLVPLLMQLKKPLGMDSKVECANSIRLWKEHNTNVPTPAEEKSKIDKFISILKKDAAKQIMQMGICTDNQGFVFYNQVLFHFMKNHLFNTTHIFDGKSKGLEILGKEEAISTKKIQAQQKTHHHRMEIKPVNPVVQLIFVSLSFKVWSKFNERFKRKHMKQPEDDYFSSSYASSDNEDDKRTDKILFQVRERTEESEEEEKPQRQYVAIPNTDIYQEEEYLYDGIPADRSFSQDSDDDQSVNSMQELDEERMKTLVSNQDHLKTFRSNYDEEDGHRKRYNQEQYVIENHQFIYQDHLVMNNLIKPLPVNNFISAKVTTISQQTVRDGNDISINQQIDQ